MPDITPALTAAPGGALLAWSRYDGHDYRVGDLALPQRTLDGAARPPPPPERSTPPSKPRAPRKPVLLYRTADPQGWEALDRGHRRPTPPPRRRRRRPPRAAKARPQVTETAEGVTFRWPAVRGRHGAGRRLGAPEAP